MGGSYSVLLVMTKMCYPDYYEKMDWEKAWAFRLQRYAHNGVEALEMAEELQPDDGHDRYQKCHTWTD